MPDEEAAASTRKKDKSSKIDFPWGNLAAGM